MLKEQTGISSKVVLSKREILKKKEGRDYNHFLPAAVTFDLNTGLLISIPCL